MEVFVFFFLSTLLALAEPDELDVFSREGEQISIEDVEEPEPILEEEQTSSTEREYPERIYKGAEWLGSSPEFIWTCWEVMEGLYIRDYKALMTTLDNAKANHPGTGVAPTGRALMWQVMMLENFDFKYEKQYKVAFDVAHDELKKSLKKPGDEAWEQFLLGAIIGVDAIHLLRKEEFLSALSQGFDAIRYIDKAKELAPNFIDSRLGDGLWLYWRSLIAMNIPGFASFADQRKEGIALMQQAERDAVFLRPAASHALTYTWIEERKMLKAESTALRLYRAYPTNLINLQLLGRIYLYRGNYPQSEKTFKKVLAIDGKNERVHFYLARLYLRWRKINLSEKYINSYLQFDLSNMHKGHAFYYQGHIFSRQKRWEEAKKSYQLSWKYAKVKGAKERVKAMDQRIVKVSK